LILTVAVSREVVADRFDLPSQLERFDPPVRDRLDTSRRARMLPAIEPVLSLSPPWFTARSGLAHAPHSSSAMGDA
jgi:hypothetical protein